MSCLNQLYLKLWLSVNPNSVRQHWRNTHFGDGNLRTAGLEAATKACGLRDVCMSAKLSLHGEQRLGQPVAKDADVNCTLNVEERDKQAQAVAADFERMRMRVVVEGGNHSEELREVCFVPFKHGVREATYGPKLNDPSRGTRELQPERWLGSLRAWSGRLGKKLACDLKEHRQDKTL